MTLRSKEIRSRVVMPGPGEPVFEELIFWISGFRAAPNDPQRSMCVMWLAHSIKSEGGFATATKTRIQRANSTG